jgi:bacillopeptidase F
MVNLHHLLLIFLAFVLYGNVTVVAQGLIGSTLNAELDKSVTDKYRVAVYLKEKANLEFLESQLKQNQVPVKDRPLLVKQALLDVTTSSQENLLDAVKAEFGPFSLLNADVQQLWINNCLVMWADEEMIEFIADHPKVDLIDLNTARKIKLLDPPKRSTSGSNRTPGAPEPGLISIGANLMWDMGYTGKNRISYSIDTGVWPEHPAIDNQFMANYVPLNMAWFAYDSELPSDKTSDHGTHTIGTALGLDENTNDTIGVAFNAYYIATDPVATSLATVKPLTDFMFAFEWAFDPDGDPLTTSDIPDVINNSWGYDVPTDDELCESYASEMFTAIQAAGIANVMSAGNSGPGPMTIGIPHHISTGLVNTFSVGAVDAHNTTLPIAGFSSRGPTICNVSGSLEIKPEVVAPGVAVRSAIRNGEYDEYQGTSMASPHVTGAVLLLREAFPNVSGEEILLALYNSALDLGDVGEDNSYGNGMINVLSAFDLLSLTNTPIPPNTSTLDLAISDIIIPASDLQCGQSLTPQIQLSNLGSELITDATIAYSIVGEAEHIFNWNGSLMGGTSETITLNPLSIENFGLVELWAKSSMNGSPIESDVINNNWVKRLNVRPESAFPFYEDFESGEFLDGTWMVRNEDAAITWDTIRTGGLNWNQYSVFMNFRQYNPKLGQNDGLITPVISLPSGNTAQLKFEMSYSFVHSSFADSLEVSISNDCGATWSSIYLKGGEELALHDSITDGDNDFIPSAENHWRTESVLLTGYEGDDILLNFKSSNYRGSYLIMDNIRVFVTEDPAGIGAVNAVDVNLYPIPANTGIYVNSDLSFLTNLKVMDLAGRTVKYIADLSISSNSTYLDVSGLPTGTYMVHFENDRNKMVRPLVIAR